MNSIKQEKLFYRYRSMDALLNNYNELEDMKAYVNVGSCLIEESQTEDIDWVNNWKQYFHQFYIDDILVILLGYVANRKVETVQNTELQEVKKHQ